MRKNIILLKISIITVVLSIIVSEKINAQVEWQNPLPIGCWIMSACYIDSTTIIATAYSGNIIKSTDDGKYWKITKLKTGSVMKGIQFSDANNGFAADDYSIYKTTDGGESWLKIYDANAYISCIHFFNQNSGVFVCDGKICKTTDGGSTWTNIYENTQDVFTSMSFPDELNGYLFGRYKVSDYVTNSFYLQTNDGGQNWNRTLYGEELMYATLFFESPDTGYKSNYDTIFRTFNSGQTWSVADVFNSPINLIQVNNSTIYAGLINGEIKCSHNEGTSWQTYKDPDNAEILCIAHNGEKCFASGRDGIPQFPVTYKSEDNGQSWDVTHPITKENLISISFCDSLNGFACGENQTMLHTSDGGKNWQIQVVDNIDCNYTSVYCLNPLTAFCVGNSGYIYKTTDGGLSWSGNSMTNSDIKRICFLNNSKGFCIGENGLILITDDGGMNWNKINTDVNNSLNAITFLDESKGFIVTNEGSLLETIDGGINWQLQMLPSSDDFKAIYFINDLVGYIAGKELYKTTDGGHIWEEIYASNKAIRDMYFTDENHGYATFPPYIKYTIDGGRTWTLIDQVSPNLFPDLEMTIDGSCFFVGNYGQIIRFPHIASYFTDSKPVHIADDLLIYPNPARNEFKISAGGSFSDNGFIEIYDLNGKLLLRRTFQINVNYKLETAKFPSGTYLIRILSKEKVKTAKLVIIR
jgi:photosystem II stability/assembly factor-like uncharacterized protein